MQSQTLLQSSSPARLGLASPPAPNPTANAPNPVIPNPSPPPSTSLFPLLPPVPRSQTLLSLMASLTSSLFEVTPHRSLYLAAFRGSLPSFLPSSSSSSGAPAASSKEEIMSLISGYQSQLFESVSQLQEILDLQDARKRAIREARAADAVLLAFTRKLREAHLVLDRLVDDYADYRVSRKRARVDSNESEVSDFALKSSLILDDVLSYAHKISYTTFAPPEHGAGVAPLRGALPPVPQDNEMRASQLYQFADLDVGVPKKPLEGRDHAAGGTLASALLAPTPPREELPPPVPAMLPITIPPGWKKGMPIELPAELPPVPAGWKPGDPITLPVDGIMVGSKAAEQRVLPPLQGVPGGQPKAAEPIQVKRVILDIDEDFSSDYSSEVGSSEEEDDEE